MAKRLLIECGWIVSLDPAIGDLKDAKILIEDDKIVEVGANIEVEADETIDALDLIVMPGLINAHLHTWQTGTKVIGSEWVSPDYHKNMHSNMATRFTAEDTFLGNVMGALNQIDNGTTTILDWCHNLRDSEMAERAVDGLEESGIRAVFGHGTAKPPTVEGETPYTHVPHPRDRLEHLRNTRLSSDDGLVTLAMAITGPEFGAFDIVVQDLKLANELGLLSSAHVWHGFNKNLPPEEQIKDAYYQLGEMGLLGPNHNIVHGCYLPEDQIRYVVDQGCSVTSTVMCEMHGHGAFPLMWVVRDMGAMPSIATDTNTLVAEDMFGEIRGALFALRFQINQQARADGNYPLKTMPVNSREALEWATMGGAKALRLDDKIGSLTPGKKADIIMLRANDTNLYPVHDPVFAITDLATGANVENVMIDGEFRKRDGKRLYAEKKYNQLRDDLMTSADRLMAESNYRPSAA
ncbi:MAG: amidohydrolase family protein [Rhodospirillaceae bacterium]|jgi:5-methylthioadenosine/S-adenosylhomocysteine deaminase|nr:amidohydrolase family protein [Rhodospirillaceae bacterium]